MIFLSLVPVLATLVFGTVYLTMGAAAPVYKLGGVLIFAAAVYLQFFSRFALAGLLIQVGLALSLALWRRFDASA